MSDLKDKFNLNIWRSFSFIHLRGRFFFYSPKLACLRSFRRTWAQKIVHFLDMVVQLYTETENMGSEDCSFS